MNKEISSFLEKSLLDASSSKPLDSLGEVDVFIRKIADNANKCKGVLAVLVTLLTYKHFHPNQDIRYHQAGMPNGFSGRTFDSQNITPFLRSIDFPCMAETGWLTRSLEQPYPYTLEYQGKIQIVKKEFLNIIDAVESRNASPSTCLVSLFRALLKKREDEQVALAHPKNLPISQIVLYLEQHFRVRTQGSARLPVLALYSAYQCMMKGERYCDKELLPLESHTSADAQSGRAGDIDIVSRDGVPFEAVEVKHGILISSDLINHAFDKFKIYPIDRYYLLTTANMDRADWEEINNQINFIARQHGCQVIVNGVYSTLRYYLRTLKDTNDFISRYIENMKSDSTVKYDHKVAWNKIVSGTI